MIRKAFFAGVAYAESYSDLLLIKSERDILDVIGLCGEQGTQLLLLYEKNLSPLFFDLSSGLAGVFFQKSANYSLRTAMVINFGNIKSERFLELISETNKGSQIRFFEEKSDAEKWLTA